MQAPQQDAPAEGPRDDEPARPAPQAPAQTEPAEGSPETPGRNEGSPVG